MSTFKVDRYQASSPVEEPASIDPDDRGYASEDSEGVILTIVEINPGYTEPVDTELAKKADQAQEAMRAGDNLTAGVLADEVLSVQPGNPFMRRVRLQAKGLDADSTLDELLVSALEEVHFLSRQLTDVEPRPEARSPLSDAALVFEMARHDYNIGNDLYERGKRTKHTADYGRSALFFRRARACVDKQAYPANYLVRLLREAVALAASGDVPACDALVKEALSMDAEFTLQYLQRHDDYAIVLALAERLNTTI